MELASQWIAILAGGWLVALGLLMALAPRLALAGLAGMGGSALVHFGEMALRVTVGAALVLIASASRFPVEMTVIGWFLIVSALVLAALPRRWHAAYSQLWAGRIPVVAVRLIAPLSIAGGLILVWCVT